MADSPKTEMPFSGEDLYHFSFFKLSWCKTDTILFQYHVTPWWVWTNCAIQSDVRNGRHAKNAGGLIIRLKAGLQRIPVVTVCTSEALRDPGFLFTIINNSSISPISFEVSAYNSWCLLILMLCCQHLLVFLSSGSVLTHQKLFSPLGFSSVYSRVLGVFHPVHSLLPQWGHIYIILLFRNTLQTGLQGKTHKDSCLICFFRGLLSLNKFLSYLYETSIE